MAVQLEDCMARSVRPLKLSSSQRRALVALSKSRHGRVAQRALIILAVAEEGMTYTSVAEQLGTGMARVRRWRKRFEDEGVNALEDLPRSGGPKAELVVTDEQRAELERLAIRARTNRQIAFRAKIILASSDGLTNLDVARKLRCSPSTVGTWRKRFIADGVAGLVDEPRPGAPRTISDADVEAILVRTLETKPKGRTHWSTRKMAEKAGASHSTVGRIWRTFGLQPHVVESFKISDDPFFVEKVRDVVGLYLNPPDHAVVLSFDEKPQIQALERAQPILPMDFGQPERQTHNYVRHGTLDLFAALNVATGKIIARTKKRHRAKDFVAFLRLLDDEVESNLDVHVILDNLSAHKAPAVRRWVSRHPRFHFHFTPTYSAWLNLVERFFGLLTQHALKRGSHTSVFVLNAAIHEYIETHNEEGKPFVWTKTADQILDKVKRFGQRTIQVHE
jgi:transposase